MNNDEQTQFLGDCKTALLDGTFKRAVFSSRGKGDDKFRARFELVVGGKKRLISYSDNQSSEEQATDLDANALHKQMAGERISPFKAATLYTDDFDLHYSENRKLVPRLYKSKASLKALVQEHNKRKNYVLREDRPYLKGLGVTSDKGVVIKKHYGKFRQIANFVEIIDRDIGTFVADSEQPISILDLGCGKGYLTFATYDYIRSRANVEPKATGIDIKTNVIDLCNDLAGSLNFDGLEFRNARIQQNKIEDVDILIALHACDTATDDALALGLRSNMKYLFCAPCCQAEIAAQLTHVDTAFELVNTYPLMKRRQADIITDVCRALLLNAMGYEVKFLEFTALEHTSKNVMLAGKLNPDVDRKKAYNEYKELKAAYGFTRHSLEENVKDLLEATL
ncbi:MAG: SAM-dependent methyltransferase [Rhizobiaceae bacterium]